ncbi:hypothetical protein [Nonomuraea sp. SBT364]|uniref:hypothetical protein n=1 Tax=Nonomuraea sp. SBT364 TaxID=1580530 RepID=UPI00066E680D|nr:hypothetical protein [Nonomuraea sp. SBT364]
MTVALSRMPVLPAAKARRGFGWVPAGLVTVAAVVVLWRFGVPLRDLGAFGGYISLGVMLPGVLLWRALGPGGGSLPADLAAGLALGYAIEVLVYLPARALGAPMAVVAWPVVTVVAFLAVPRLRRHWRGSGVRVPLWWAWAMSGIVGYLLAWSARQFYPTHGLTWPGNAGPYVDMPYHLALVGELRHHMPPQFPAVLGEPLSYHWFVYAEMAATSWVTGIEPQTLLYRLAVLPMLAATMVLLAVTGWRLAGRPWVGIESVVATCLACSPALHAGGELFPAASPFGAWLSPTQTLGALLFAPVALALVGLLRGGRGRWVVVGVLLLALTGAKATYLPLLVAGLGLVLVVRLLTDRRVHRPALAAGGFAVAGLLIAQFVLFAHGSQGMTVTPLDTMRRLWRAAAELSDPEMAALPLGLALALAALYVAVLAGVWAGIAGFFVRPVPGDDPPPGGAGAGGRWAALCDPGVLLLGGIGVAGVGAVLVLGHPAASQLYFLTSAKPYLAIVAVAGAGVLLRAFPGAWRVAAGALAAGAGLAVLVAAEFGVEMPVRGLRPADVALPYLVLGGVLVVVAAALAVWRKPVAVVLVALACGFTVPAAADRAVRQVGPSGGSQPMIPEGGVEAARWLREHSGPGDVVATNLHCRPTVRRHCDSRHYWVSAYSERRVLVEGWAYAGSTLARTPETTESYLRIGFADPLRLAVNDAAFQTPSEQTIGRLAQKYGVKWLFVEGVRETPDVGRFARLRFRMGECAVYEVIAR